MCVCWAQARLCPWQTTSAVLVQRTTSLLPSDPLNKRRLSSDLWGDPLEKRPLESEGQAQANDEENFLVAPVHLPVDGEEPTSVKSFRCQYTVEQKQLIGLYARHHRICPTERKLGIPWKNVQWWGWGAFVNVTTNRATPISNFTHATQLSCSDLISVLGTAPINVPFYPVLF